MRFSKEAVGLIALGCLPLGSLAADIIKSSGFTNCDDNASIRVNNADITFDRASKVVTFDVSGTSTKEQKVKAALVVTAYGVKVFSKNFNPCDDETKVEQLCPGKKLALRTH
jgi:hypothetical protein